MRIERLGDNHRRHGLRLVTGLAGALLLAGGARAETTSALSAAGAPWTSAQVGFPTINGSAYGASTYLAVGRYGTILTSPDGLTWTTRRRTTSNEELTAAAFGGGLFVVTGVEQRLTGGTWSTLSFVLTSSNGISWARRSLPAAAPTWLSQVAYGNGRFVIVGSAQGTDHPVLSSIDGVNWTAVRVPGPTSYGPSDVAFGGATFVAVGQPGAALVSSDGLNWSSRPLPVTPQNAILRVVHDGTVFVATGSRTVLTSADGFVWASQPDPPAYVGRVAAGGGRIVGIGPLEPYASTDHGVTWTKGEYPATSALLAAGQTIVHGPRGFVAWGYSGSLMTSVDGLRWTNRTTTASRLWVGVAQNGEGRFCAGGYFGAAASSTDGARWTTGTVGTVTSDPRSRPNLNGMAAGRGLFAAADQRGRIHVSSDCATWTSPVLPPDWFVQDVSFTNDLFVAVGADSSVWGGALVAVSADGIEWEPRPTGVRGSLRTLAFGAGRWVAFGEEYWNQNIILTSEDGLNWTKAASPIPINQALFRLRYENGLFLAISLDGLWTSADGSTWTKRLEPEIVDVAYGEGRFVGVGAGKLFSSADGLVWTAAPAPTPRYHIGIAFDPNLRRFVAVGESVIVYTNSPMPGGRIQFSSSSLSVNERGPSLTVTVTRTGGTGTASVDYVVSEGTATLGKDYRATAGTLRFLAGQTSATFRIEILEDTIAEGPETVLLRLKNPQGAAALGERTAAVVTIVDNEPRP